MADTLESLEIEVKHSASGADSEIGKVTDALSKLGDTIDKIFPKLNSLSKAMANIKNAKVLSGAFKGDGTEASPIGKEIQEEVKNAGKIEVLTRKLMDAEAKMNKAFSGGNLSGAFRARGEMLSTQAAIEKELAKAQPVKEAPTTFQKLAERVKAVGEAAKKAAKPMNRLVASFGRIAFYRMIRMALNELAKAFMEGLQNSYAFSQGIAGEGHRFATAMDSMSSATLTMKNQLGSAFISLLAIITPIVNAIISVITKLADALAQLFAAFTGTTYLKANNVTKKFADSTAAGAAAAKEWKNQLLGFDEINRLEEPSGGGGGGGSGALSPSDMFQESEISGIFKKIAAAWKDLIDSIDFGPINNAIGNLKSAFGELGSTIGSAIGWAWNNILAPFIRWVVENCGPALINFVASFVNLTDAVLKVVGPAFQWLWENILKPMFSFIGDVVIGTLETLTKLFNDLAGLLSGEISFKEFIDGLTTSETIIGSIIIAVVTVMSAMKLWNGLLVGLFLAIGKVNSAIAFLTSPIGLVIIAIAALIAIGVLLIKNWESIKEFVVNHFGPMFEDIKMIWEGIKDVFQGLIDFIAGVFTGDWTRAWDGVTSIFTGACEVITGAISTVFDFIGGLISAIATALNWLSSLFQGINGLANSNAARIEADGSIYLQGFANGGYPSEGQLFMARESGAGAELVGNIGGRTAVASNNDILEGVRQGVYEAVSSAMSNGDRDVNVKVYLDSREIKNGQKRLARASGV